MNRQQIRADVRAFAKEIKAYKSGRLNNAQRMIMSARIARLQNAGVLNKPKPGLKTFWKKLVAKFKRH